MSFIQRYKNIYISLLLYVVAILVVYVIPTLIMWLCSPKFAYSPSYFGYSLLTLAAISVFVGIFFGFRSIHARESFWAGHLTVVIGGLVLASPFILYILAVNGLL